jgi:hypothetical protein
VQLLHAGVQNGTTMGLAPEKLSIRAFLQGLSQGCFENRFLQKRGSAQATKQSENCWPDANLPNAPVASGRRRLGVSL